MKSILTIIFAISTLGLTGCGGPEVSENAVPPPNTSVPSNKSATTASTPKNGNYGGKGVVTKINDQQGSVELKHENIEGLMPAMQMEFNVTDKAFLNGLKVGDAVDFVVEYKNGQEKINSITKTK